jgi:hypothetical protein
MADKAEREGKGRAASTRRRSPAQVAVVAFCLLVGAALIGLGLPRTIGAWLGLPAAPTIQALQERRPVSPEAAADALAAQKRSIPWDPAASRMTDLAYLEEALALRMPDGDPRRAELFAAAEKDVIDGLRLNPADGIGWLRLARLRVQRAAPLREVAVALMQSLDMAPNFDLLWLNRAQLLLVYWPVLTPEELLAMHRQLRTIWTATPRPHQQLKMPLLVLGSLTGGLRQIEAALADDPQLLAEFEALKERLPPMRLQLPH